MDIKTLIDRICENKNISLEHVVRLLKADEKEALYLFNKANDLTLSLSKKEVHLRAIIEFSNICRCKCSYCGLNINNKSITRYRMKPDEIVKNALEACKAGYRTIVLQSGEDPWYDTEKILYVIKTIKSVYDVAITLSIGERSYEEYKLWKEHGADRYLIKHETSDENIYNTLHPHSNYKNRIERLKWLKELGYQAGSGFMIGLPGQNVETLAKDILLLKELEVEMAGIGPFIPHPQTPLGKHAVGNLYMVLKAIAITRLIMKKINLPSTTAFTVASKDNTYLPHPLNCGANVIMKKVEPHKYRRHYEIYPKCQDKPVSMLEERLSVENEIEKLGLLVSKTKGDIIN